jgi:hypothetical protein
MTTNQSQTASTLQGPLVAQHLSPARRSLVDLMHLHQFGRIENMPIRDGQPILDSTVNVVRVARLTGNGHGTTSVAGDEFELKRPVRELFTELARLGNGTVIRLEFRHGLPFLLETAATVST